MPAGNDPVLRVKETQESQNQADAVIEPQKEQNKLGGRERLISPTHSIYWSQKISEEDREFETIDTRSTRLGQPTAGIQTQTDPTQMDQRPS